MVLFYLCFILYHLLNGRYFYIGSKSETDSTKPVYLVCIQNIKPELYKNSLQIKPYFFVANSNGNRKPLKLNDIFSALKINQIPLALPNSIKLEPSRNQLTNVE